MKAPIQRLAADIEAIAEFDEEYWAFEQKDQRDFLHSIFHYPAMMVPRVQRELMEACLRWDNSIRLVYDPFVGSGTVMTETMMLGRDFVGTDINPLAILLCRAKSELFDAGRLERDLQSVLRVADGDTSEALAVSFPGLDKWFQPEVAVGLSKLHRAIRRRRDGRVRRFWWVALAETIRLSSNSRTSTVKLHLRPQAELGARPDPRRVFEDVAKRNVRTLATQQQLLQQRQTLIASKYSGTIDLQVADVLEGVQQKADLLMTSPPYGDNHTTVTYGQASFLPLQWIDRRDIALNDRDRCVESTHQIDTASLGGSRRNALDGVEPALDRSASLRRTMDRLRNQPRDRRVRVAAFFRDFDASLQPILRGLRPGAVMVWTIGDRSVGGERIPMSSILRQLLGPQAELVTRLERRIPASRKRMPTRNSIAATMGLETILVLRKAAQ